MVIVYLLNYDMVCDVVWIVKKVKFKSKILAFLFYLSHKPFFDDVKMEYG